MSRVSTCGLPTVSSKPSRRMSSTSTASCSSPRPWTSQASGRSVSCTRSDTLPIELLLQARLDLPRGELAAVLPGERRGVDADRHRQRRLVDRDDRQRPRVLEVGERLADRHVRDAGDGDDLPRPGLLRADAVERLGDEELRELGPRDAAVGAAPGDVLAAADRPVAHAADRQAAEVGRRVEVRDVGLQRMALLVGGRGDVLDEQVHERLEVGALLALRQRRPAGPARSCRRSGTRSGSRPRRGRGTARRPRRRPRRCARPAGRPCSRRARPAAAPPAPCAARSASAAAGPPTRRRAAGRRRPSSARARPRRRSPRARACRRC